MERKIDRLRREGNTTATIPTTKSLLYYEALERLTNRLRTHGIKVESTKMMVLSGSIPRMEQRSLTLNPTTQKMELKIIHPQQTSLAVIPQDDVPYDPDLAPPEGDELIRNASDALKKEWKKQPLIP